MSNKNDATLKIKTLSQRLLEAMKRGSTDNFKVVDATLIDIDHDNNYSSKEVAITDYFRFEGYTDPQDSAILYLIKTNDGHKGTLIDAYGVYADSIISNFVNRIESIQKKPSVVTSSIG